MPHFDDAMKLLDTLPDTDENRERRISLLVKQCYVFRLLMRLPEYYDLLKRYEPMARGLGKGLLGGFYVALGTCEYSFGSLDQATETTSRGSELCEAEGDIEGASFAYIIQEWIHLFKGSYGAVFDYKEDVLRMLKQRFIPRWHVLAMGGVSNACSYLGR